MTAPTPVQSGPTLPIDKARAQVSLHVMGLLKGTDVWCARHVEDGVSLTPDRKAYRAALRQALAQIENADDPYSVALPTPPANP